MKHQGPKWKEAISQDNTYVLSNIHFRISSPLRNNNFFSMTAFSGTITLLRIYEWFRTCLSNIEHSCRHFHCRRIKILFKTTLKHQIPHDVLFHFANAHLNDRQFIPNAYQRGWGRLYTTSPHRTMFLLQALKINDPEEQLFKRLAERVANTDVKHSHRMFL